MRLREPFNGYKLSSGHFMFHMAYLVGSRIACDGIIPHEELENDHIAYANGDKLWASDVLFQLNLAHILVPTFTGLSTLADNNGYNAVSKTFDIVSIF